MGDNNEEQYPQYPTSVRGYEDNLIFYAMHISVGDGYLKIKDAVEAVKENPSDENKKALDEKIKGLDPVQKRAFDMGTHTLIPTKIFTEGQEALLDFKPGENPEGVKAINESIERLKKNGEKFPESNPEAFAQADALLGKGEITVPSINAKQGQKAEKAPE
ncbi:MAG: hypothetical protein COV36_03300 [Alphaproteobacteria bacterium CG11_big_fil_rev_8_21_14_0_20_44_7]|nr:MAG: hypothetical protein COV36_03300 [Alphaproteobacteria bacterium CG11_big_fil_rev_8_21_14_0_20_44_7]